MGFLQASNGIDSKANVLVTGSLFVSTNIYSHNLMNLKIKKQTNVTILST